MAVILDSTVLKAELFYILCFDLLSFNNELIFWVMLKQLRCIFFYILSIWANTIYWTDNFPTILSVTLINQVTVYTELLVGLSVLLIIYLCTSTVLIYVAA